MKMIRNPVRESYAEEDDYIGDDGLLYCGNCHTRKEKEILWPNLSLQRKVIKFVPIMCKCKIAEKKATEERIRRSEDMLEIRRARISSMMDESYRTATFDNYIKNKSNEKYWRIATNYCKGFKTMFEKNQGLLFYGCVGTGKSYTAACIANSLMDMNTSVVMTSFVKLMQELQGFNKEREEYLSNKLCNVRLLIIDDLGAERNTDYALEKVYGIIDNRYRAKKPLILTTNLTLAQMKTANDIRYERIYDRIFEMCYPLEFTGVSWRKKEAARRFEETKRVLEE